MSDLIEPGGTEIALQELLASEGYELVWARLREMLETSRNALESTEASESKLRFYQGQVYALRRVLEVPNILIEDAKRV